jgi:hypothetical protein
MVERIIPGARDKAIHELRGKISEIDKQIEHARRMQEYDPAVWGMKRLRLGDERQACVERIAELDRHRSVEESRDWSPSSSGFFHGSNY